MLLDSLDIDAAAFSAQSGWTIKPEGACRGDVCVPLGDGFDARTAAQRLGMAIVEHDGMFAVGPDSLRGHALASAEAPELVLDDIDGNEFRLSSLRGQKVVIVAWAPY